MVIGFLLYFQIQIWFTLPWRPLMSAEKKSMSNYEFYISIKRFQVPNKVLNPYSIYRYFEFKTFMKISYSSIDSPIDSYMT